MPYDAEGRWKVPARRDYYSYRAQVPGQKGRPLASPKNQQKCGAEPHCNRSSGRSTLGFGGRKGEAVDGHAARRLGGIAISAALLAGILGVAPVRAATPTCGGKKATIVGTRGKDRLMGTRRADVIVAKGGQDVVDGRGGDDLICSGRAFDLVAGGAGDDRIYAGKGADSITPGAGNDTVDGGSNTAFGADDVRFDGAKQGVTASLLTNTATGEGRDRFVRVEQFIGSDYDDDLTGDDGDNVLFGLGGNDHLRGLGGGFDSLGGHAGDDVIEGGDGQDFLDSYGHAAAFGLPVSEAPINIDLTAQTLTGQGNDTISGIECANGTPGDDVAVGSDGPNCLTGFLDGNDTIDGRGGDDLIDGGDGDDTLDGGAGTDAVGHLDHSVAVTVDLQAGTAVGKGTDQIRNFEIGLGSFLDDTIAGDAGDNGLAGGPGDDTLDGRAGDDMVFGDWEIPDPAEQVFGEDIADGGPGTDGCMAETETNCEAEPEPPNEPASYLGAKGY